MLKKSLFLTLAIAILCVGTTSVFAAQTTIKALSKYAVASGFGMEYQGLTGTYDYAKANMVIDSLNGSGSKKTVFTGYKKSGLTYLKKTSKTVSITSGSCQLASIGKIGKGTWKIVNDAFSGNNNYVGWSGQLGFISSSEE